MPTHSQIRSIADLNDPLLADFVHMTDVRLRSHLEVERGVFIAESYAVIERALDAGITPRAFLMSPKWVERFTPLFTRFEQVPVFVAKEQVLESITGFHVHRGALASMQRPQPRPLASLISVGADGSAAGTASARGRSRIAILEDIVDHTNVGAAFRSAAAFGMDAVLVTPRCADPLYRRAIRVSMGTVFQVPWARIDPWPGGIDMLREAGFAVAGMTLGEGAVTLDEFSAAAHEKVALVFGTEGHGITPAAERHLDHRVTIPMMNGVDSLNIAAACAVAFYATR